MLDTVLSFFYFFTECSKSVKMRVAIAFFLLISLAMAFKLRQEEPALPEDDQEDPALFDDGEDMFRVMQQTALKQFH